MTVEIKTRLEFDRGAEGADKRKALKRPSNAVARILAKTIKARFVKEGDRGWQYKTTRDRFNWKAISPRYPKVGGGRQVDSGAHLFKDSADFHRKQGVKGGSFNVSGGLWKGLTVKAGSRISMVMFRGRSEGQGMAYKKGATAHRNEPHFRYMKGKKRVVAKPKKVSNALKAATVLKSTRRALLTPTKGETEAVGKGVTAAIISATKAIGVGDSAARVDWPISDILKLTQGGKGSRSQRALAGKIARALS